MMPPSRDGEITHDAGGASRAWRTADAPKAAPPAGTAPVAMPSTHAAPRTPTHPAVRGRRLALAPLRTGCTTRTPYLSTLGWSALHRGAARCGALHEGAFAALGEWCGLVGNERAGGGGVSRPVRATSSLMGRSAERSAPVASWVAMGTLMGLGGGGGPTSSSSEREGRSVRSSSPQYARPSPAAQPPPTQPPPMQPPPTPPPPMPPAPCPIGMDGGNERDGTSASGSPRRPGEGGGASVCGASGGVGGGGAPAAAQYVAFALAR
jgi:hypothetical protein